MSNGQEALDSLGKYVAVFEETRSEYNEKIRTINMELDQLETYKEFTIPNLQKALLIASKIIDGEQVSEKDLVYYDVISNQVKVVLKNE